jgi:cytochrome c
MVTRYFAISAAAILMVSSAGRTAPPESSGDPVKGKQIFARCAICHSTVAGQARIGPSLAGVVGRVSGSVPGYTYSPAMKGAKLTWTAAQLDSYLIKPSAKVPGTKMIFPGLSDPGDRANVIAYLTSLK